MKRTGMPLLLVALLSTIGAALMLFAQDPVDASDLWAGLMLLSAGLVLLGAWAAVEIRNASYVAKQTDWTRDESTHTQP